MPNLVFLFLSYNKITDVELSDMPSLDDLVLHHNNISGVSGIMGLPNLTQLYLSDNEMEDVSGLSGLPGLEQMNLGNNGITDISGLAGLTNLKTLHLNNNQITDIRPLSGMSELSILSLDNNKIIDISVLSKLTKLQQLTLENNEIVDVSGLSELTNMRELYLEDNKITDIKALSKLPKLEKLSLGNTAKEYDPDVMPSRLKKENVVLKIDYNYADELPETEAVRIYTGTEYFGKSVCVAALNEDKSYTILGYKYIDWEGYVTMNHADYSSYIIIVNPMGDVNCDGEVTAQDALVVLMNIVGIEQDYFVKQSANMCCDGEIDAEDALEILKYIVGLSDFN